MHKTMHYGYRYKVKKSSAYWEQYARYKYAQPVAYADKCVIGDCWIVDDRGDIHPGYSNSPVPLCVQALSEPEQIADE